MRNLLIGSLTRKIEGKVTRASLPRSGKKGRMPTPIKGLLFLLIVILGLLTLRLWPAVGAEGWLPTATLIVAFGFVVIALIEVVRTR
jgi:hypothetical protein